MKTENKTPMTRKLRNHRPADVKAPEKIPAWTPQSSLLTREEFRKIVIDQIG